MPLLEKLHQHLSNWCFEIISWINFKKFILGRVEIWTLNDDMKLITKLFLIVFAIEIMTENTNQFRGLPLITGW